MGDVPLPAEWVLIRSKYDNRSHVMYLPEQGRHLESVDCDCMPEINSYGVVVHAVLTPNAPGVAGPEH